MTTTIVPTALTAMEVPALADAPPTETDDVDEIAAFTRKEYLRLVGRENARKQREAELASHSPIPIGERLDEIDDTEELELVSQIIVEDSITLISAQRKTGKTTFALNMVAALQQGTRFLNKYDTVQLASGIGWLNYEMNKRMFRRWADKIGVKPDGFTHFNAVGRRGWFYSPANRERVGQQLQENGVRLLIVDSFGKAFKGNENDNSEVIEWLEDFHTWALSYGVREIVLLAHMGKKTEGGSRGALAIEEKPDNIIYLERKDSRDKTAPVEMWSLGRLEDIPRHFIEYDADTCRVRAGNPTRPTVASVKQQVLDTLADLPSGGQAPSKTGLASSVGGNRQMILNAIEELRADGRVYIKRDGKAHRVELAPNNDPLLALKTT